MFARCMLPLALAAVSMAVDAQTFQLALGGALENPPNASPGSGGGTLVYNANAHTLAINLSFSGLLGNTTAAHIHCCADPPANAGVATQTPSFATFPLGVASGTHGQTLDLTLAGSFNATFINNNGGTPASAEAALVAGIAAGRAYYNIHTSMFPGGEIRGFPVAVAIFANGFETATGINRLAGSKFLPQVATTPAAPQADAGPTAACHDLR